MNGYPPVAHILAALVGKPFGSAMMGLSLVSVTAVFGCYFLFVRGICPGSVVGTAAAVLIAAAGLYIGRGQYAIEGYEIYYNFFYARMTGQFLFLAFAFWMTRVTTDWRARLAVSAMATFLVGWVYLLASINIAMTYICFEGLFFLRRTLESRRLHLSEMLPVAAGAILPVLVVVHPTFRFMVSISGNNGALNLHAFGHLPPRFAAGLLAISLMLGVLAPDTPRWRKGTLFLATAGCAAAVAALAQFSAFRFLHVGSDYAVKEHAYGVFTLLVFGLAAGAAPLIERRSASTSARPLTVVLPPTLALACAACAPVERADRIDGFIAYEAKLADSIAHRAPQDALGNTASRNHAFGWELNHAATLADLVD